jgi:hypothetical protein
MNKEIKSQAAELKDSAVAWWLAFRASPWYMQVCTYVVCIWAVYVAWTMVM